eukprot:scaffold51559_cov31-Tisochrysis_lutea.AAC.11
MKGKGGMAEGRVQWWREGGARGERERGNERVGVPGKVSWKVRVSTRAENVKVKRCSGERLDRRAAEMGSCRGRTGKVSGQVNGRVVEDGRSMEKWNARMNRGPE